MFNNLKTIEQARAYRYNKWAGNRSGSAYIDGRCAYEVANGVLYSQCARKNGHGINKKIGE